MALYGGQVQAINMAPDTRASVAAARDLAMTGAQGIAGMVGQVGDYFKQQGEKKKLIKKSDVQIDAALKLFPDLAPALQGYRDQLKDENLPLDERTAIADSISNVINMGIGEMRNAQSNLFKKQQLEAEAGYRERMATAAETRAGASLLGAQQKAREIKSEEVPVVNAATGEKDSVIINRDAQGRMRDPVSGKVIKDLFKYANEGEGWEAPEEPAMPTPTSQAGGTMSDAIAGAANGTFNISYKTRDQLPASSPTSRQISLDFNAAPSKNAKGIEIIIPNNATEEERQIAQEYVAKTQQYFAERGVNVPARGVRTAKENGRGTPNRFHTEPFFVGDAASRAVMEKDPDGYAQVLASTLGRIPNATFIPPHKSNDPGAADGKFNERDFAKGSIIPALERLSQQRSAQASSIGIDDALSMGGDMTQQAMGTPEQQAIMARMIEEGQGMATVQNIPQGAVPTDPSVAAQQSQLPQQATPQVNRRLLSSRKAEPVEKVEIVTGPTAQALNLDPRGTYEVSRKDGNITGVQTITSAPTIGETAKAEASKADLEKAKAAKDISIKTISEFVNDKGEPTEALQSAVGYGEALATGIAQYAPILGTQSGKTRSDQQRLARLVEGSVLDAASLLKPVSNTDLKMLIQNRPQVTDPVETWTEYFREIRSILKNPNNYIDAAEQEKPQTATQKLRGKLQGQ